jgi:hypothetical protein
MSLRASRWSGGARLITFLAMVAVGTVLARKRKSGSVLANGINRAANAGDSRLSLVTVR